MSIAAAIALIAVVIVIVQTITRKPPIGGLYGSAIAMDSLANTVIGGESANESAYRFRASTSSILESVRIYIMGADEPGYGAGTGGTFEVTVQENGPGDVPSGSVLATTTYRPATGADQVVTWQSGAALTAGTLYHIVFRNIDPDPASNYASINGVLTYEPTTPRQRLFSDVDWGQPLRSDSGAWTDRPGMAPIMQLTYADGTKAGMGYMEVWIRSHKEIAGAAMARESITVSDVGRIVTKVWVRLMRIDGESPLSVSLQRADGSVIEEGTIAAADIPIGVPGIHDGEGHATWASYTFTAPHTLEAGNSYNLALSTAPDTTYSIFVIREGVRYGYGPLTYFADGRAQYAGDGQTWEPFTQDGGGPLDQGDLQFYFE